MKDSTLADVIVRSTADVEVLRSSLRRSPYAELAVGVVDDGVLAVTPGGEVVAFAGPLVGCLASEEAWRPVVGSLYAWRIARLDFGMLRHHGLPLWCRRHRAERSPCGRLEPR
ncbi:hypothetical protein [Saccharothrix australiensis]|uniref:Uncharacterized protein n=1 Tax=Saccharothrix australiensis TaxID=2072 RepID=A0A495VUC0_9PSEU|nr:hypothetical protein [Saccharothrix australiensis]RKT52949.1 hypothetical protein C8E97_1490 [Saccharothrix australiensis]